MNDSLCGQQGWGAKPTRCSGPAFNCLGVGYNPLPTPCQTTKPSRLIIALCLSATMQGPAALSIYGRDAASARRLVQSPHGADIPISFHGLPPYRSLASHCDPESWPKRQHVPPIFPPDSSAQGLGQNYRFYMIKIPFTSVVPFSICVSLIQDIATPVHNKLKLLEIKWFK